jgi:hypothetical protein
VLSQVAKADISSSGVDSIIAKETNMVRIRSNFARNKVVCLDGHKLVLHFDGKGFADCPRHLLPILEVEMKYKPGRYIVLDTKPSSSPSAVSAELSSALEELSETLEKERKEEPPPPPEESSDDDKEEDEVVPEQPSTEVTPPKPAPRKRGQAKKTNKK